ncbi:GTPase IMAP family member 8-like, partial [Clarias magur]
ASSIGAAALPSESPVSAKDVSVAFCSIAEIFFTDLCMEEGAAERCKEAIEKALHYDQNNPEALQLMASYLFSIEKPEEGREYLIKSVSSWLPSRPKEEESSASAEQSDEDEEQLQSNIPPYESRITTAKLLIEVEEFEMATDVLEGLLEEDDEVVQVWYLLGWLYYLQLDKSGSAEDSETLKKSARIYLTKAKKFYMKMHCEDVPMLEHTELLLEELGGVPFISELRIVLLGNKGAGKTSLANMILGRQATSPKNTAQCVKLRGVAAGRLVTLVDSPGWWKNFLVHETPEFQKQELVLSMAHCQSGVHAVLLVIRADAPYTEKNKTAAQQHLELFGKDIWKHTVVVFTYGDHFQDQTVEQYIESEGEAFLQRLVRKCGNRYHIFNIDRYCGTQVKELLDMIEDMVVRNSGSCCEMDKKCLYEVTDMRREAEEKANKRRMIVKKQRDVHEGHTYHMSNIRMVLLGYRGSGKSSIKNNIFGRENTELKRTSQCVKTQGEVAGKVITILDTPGWWKTLTARDTAELDKHELLRSTCLCPPGPHALLLALRLDMPFRDEEMKSLEDHMGLLGEQVWKHSILVFTHGDLLGDLTVEQYIESEGEGLKILVAKCRNRYHVLNNKNFLDGTQVMELFKKTEEMVAENKSLYFEMHPRTYKEMKQKWRLMEKKSKMRQKVNRKRMTRSVK